MAQLVRTYEYPAFVDQRRAHAILVWTSVFPFLCGTALWALVPVALHSILGAHGRGASYKWQCPLLASGFANPYGALINHHHFFSVLSLEAFCVISENLSTFPNP